MPIKYFLVIYNKKILTKSEIQDILNKASALSVFDDGVRD